MKSKIYKWAEKHTNLFPLIIVLIGIFIFAYIIVINFVLPREWVATESNSFSGIKMHVIESQHESIDEFWSIERDLSIPKVRWHIQVEPEKIYYPVNLAYDVQDFMFEKCEEYGIPSALVIAIIESESGFRSNVISSTNDYGLMQINQVAFGWLQKNLGITNLLDPKQNILGGIYILHYYLEQCNGNLQKMLMCYAYGAGKAQIYFTLGVYTTEYIDDILERMRGWHADLMHQTYER